MNAIGKSYLRVEDAPLLRGAARYCGDLTLEDAGEVVFVRSTMAHARIAGIDVAGATAAEGVIGVYTMADLPELPRYSTVAGMPEFLWRPVLATDVVRFVGEPIAMVVATSFSAAVDAAEQVFVEYAPLDVVVDVDAAVAPDAPIITQGDSNVAITLPATRPDEDIYSGAALVVEATFDNQRVGIVPLEPNVIVAEPDGDGMRIWLSTQAPHAIRNQMAPLLGLARENLHVIAPATGGGFGAKTVAEHELTAVAGLSKQLGRRLRWKQSRSENMATAHGRSQRQHVRVACDDRGTVLAIHADIIGDGGAYPAVGAYLPMLTQRMMAGVYSTRAVTSSAGAVATNTAPPTAYRGAGRPEATCLLERVIDIAAAELNLDPVEIRRRNLLSPDQFPYDTPTGATYDVGDYQASLDRAIQLAGYDDLRAEQQRRRAENNRHLLGIGVATYVEVTAGAGPTEFADVEVHRSGRASVLVGTFGHGQGHHTTMAQIASDVLHIPVDRIDVVDGDTALVARGEGTFSSRSIQVGGTAVHVTATKVVDHARRLAADILEANAEDIVLGDVGFSVAGVPSRAIGWEAVVAKAEEERPDDIPTWRALAEDTDWERAAPTFPFGAHIAVVEIDTETGRTTLMRHIAVDDCGTLINPLLATGQVHGGIAQGAAQALFEHVQYDDDGNLLTGTLLDYLVPSALELPMFETDHTETPTPVNPLGAKGIGESGTIGATPAVHNAVVDALSHLGVRHLDMPCTPEKVWSAIATGAGDGNVRITRAGR